jgi:excinuclease UvrABC helicase subunit UvrB
MEIKSKKNSNANKLTFADEQIQETSYLDKDDINSSELHHQFKVLENGKLIIDQLKSDEEDVSSRESHVSKIMIFQPIGDQKRAIKPLNLNKQVLKQIRDIKKPTKERKPFHVANLRMNLDKL